MIAFLPGAFGLGLGFATFFAIAVSFPA